MSMRRYVAVRAAWQAGMVVAFVSLVYLFVFDWGYGGFRGQPSYGSYLARLLHGSFGKAYSLRVTADPAPPPSANQIVWSASLVTLMIVLLTMIFTLLLALALAFLGVRRARLKPVVRSAEYVGISLQPIWVGILLLYILWKSHTRLFVVGYCTLHGSGQYACSGALDWLSKFIWPALTLSIFFGALYARRFRYVWLESRQELAERTKAGEKPPLVRSDLRTFYGLALAKLLGRDFGVMLGFAWSVESLFGLPGLGNTLNEALNAFSPAVMAGILIWATALAAAVNLLVDIACAAIDPRFRRF